MGWIGSAGTEHRPLIFPTREEAAAYAAESGIAYDPDLPLTRHAEAEGILAGSFP
jgi:hypothetical protein